jgi:hypothetical protein
MPYIPPGAYIYENILSKGSKENKPIVPGDISRTPPVVEQTLQKYNLLSLSVEEKLERYAAMSADVWGWDIVTVDDSEGGKSFTSIDAINPAAVTYYHNTGYGNMTFARSDDAPLSCWEVEIYDVVGGASSSCVRFLDEDTIYIAYREGASNNLNFIKNISGVWGSPILIFAGVSEIVSMVVINPNVVYVAFYDNNGALRFGKTINGGADWTTAVVDNSSNAGVGASIHAVNENVVYISYWRATTSTVMCAKTENAGGAWTLNIVADLENGYFGQTAVYAPSATTVYVCYDDPIQKILRIGKSTNSGAAFTLSTIDNNGTINSHFALKGLDANRLLVTYTVDPSSLIDPYVLRFAKTINGATSWSIEKVHDACSGHVSICAIDATKIRISFVSGGSAVLVAKT